MDKCEYVKCRCDHYPKKEELIAKKNTVDFSDLLLKIIFAPTLINR